MKILFISQLFTPEPFFKGAPYIRRFQHELGHEVYVLTGFPHYPGSNVYEGYKIDAWQWDGRFEDLNVLRTAVYPSHDNSAIKRSLNYLTFGLSTAFFGGFKIPKVDLLYVYHPPATVGFTALMFKLFRRIPFVYEIQDMWPDTLRATGMVNSEFMLKILGKWCEIIYKYASRIVVISPGFKSLLVERGVPEDKIEVIYNACDESNVYPHEINTKLAKKCGMEGKFNILFAGNIGLAQALDAVIDAADLINKKYPKIQFVFVGGGVDTDRLKAKTDTYKLKNVLFIPTVPPSEIGDYFTLADVLLVHLKDDPLFKITIPGKTQAYMASGKPIIIGVRGDAAELVERSGAGFACNPEDAQSIADIAIKMYELSPAELKSMGEKGLKFYHEELSLKVGLQKLDNIFREVVGLNKG